MKQKLLALSLALLLLGSCTPLAPSPSEKPIVSSGALLVDYASQELLEAEASYDRYVVPDAEESTLVYAALTAEVALTDVQLLSIEVLFDDAQDTPFYYVVREVLYEQELLLHDRPLVFGSVFLGVMPTSAVSYVDENGDVRYFALQMSGKDGSLLLSEITVESEPRTT